MTTLIADPKKLSEGDPLTAETLALADQVVLIDVSTGKNALASIEEFAERLPAPDLAIADVDGLQAALDSKATSSSTAASLASLAADIDALETAVDGKAAAVHTHAVADVTGLQAALDAKAAAADLATLETEVDGKAAAVHTHAIADVTGLQTVLDGKVDSADVGAAGGVASLDGSGKVPVAQIPAVALSDVFQAADQTAMLALTAERGDVCVRSDLNKSFVLSTDDPTTLADWIELKTPTDAVLSVAGRTGAVVLTGADIGGGDPTFSSVGITNYLNIFNGSLSLAYGVLGMNPETGRVHGPYLESTRATGAGAPLVVASTVKVDNLNADQLDGKHAAAFVEHALADAKGDLLVATAADTVARLAVGTNGQVLTADSSAAGGVKWADAAAGGAIDLGDGALVNDATGDDDTGTVGDPSKPYKTPQAAYTAGARTFHVVEKAGGGSYGGITTTANAVLHFKAAAGVARIGAINAPGYALEIHGEGLERTIFAGVSNKPSADGAGAAALTLYDLTVTGNVVNSGRARSFSNAAGGQGGTLTTRNVRIEGTTEANGEEGGGGESPGGTGAAGGAGGTINATDTVFVGDVNANGGSGGGGGAGDGDNGGGTGGPGGAAGFINPTRCHFLAGCYAAGGAGGVKGTDGGSGEGTDGDGAQGGYVDGQFSQFNAIDVGGGGGTVAGGGGSVTLKHCDILAGTAALDGEGIQSGSAEFHFVKCGVVNVGTRSGTFVNESGTTYTDWS